VSAFMNTEVGRLWLCGFLTHFVALRGFLFMTMADIDKKGLCRRVVCNKQNVAHIHDILKERAIELHTSASTAAGKKAGGGLVSSSSTSANGRGLLAKNKTKKNKKEGNSRSNLTQQQQKQYAVQLKYIDADGDKCALLSNADVVEYVTFFCWIACFFSHNQSTHLTFSHLLSILVVHSISFKINPVSR
jgi:hypothetical protein